MTEHECEFCNPNNDNLKNYGVTDAKCLPIKQAKSAQKSEFSGLKLAKGIDNN